MVAGTRTERLPESAFQLSFLLQLVDVRTDLRNLACCYGKVGDGFRSCLFNGYSEGVMVTRRIGKHTVEFYDTIDALPVVRFHKFQKMLLVDAGIGADMSAFDTRIEKTRRYLMTGDTKNASLELENLRQCVFMIQNQMQPKHLAFAALVTKIDGKEIPFTDAGQEEVLKVLAEGTVEEVADGLSSAKKKIDEELNLYFPTLFNQSDVKEYYDILKRRTLLALQKIVAGEPIDGDDIEDLTTKLICYAHPKVFSGSEGVEIQYDRQFENLCLALSAQLNIKPKKCSVLEFYNAFDYLAQQNKRERRDRAAKSGR